MRPDPKCVIDRSRPCGGCVAPGPDQCPYAYLLDPEEMAGVVRAARDHRDQRNRRDRAEAVATANRG